MLKKMNKKRIIAVVVILCLLAVFHLAPHQVVLVVILVWFLFFQKGILKDLDYNLLLTFIFFFILIGNLGRIPAVRNTLQELLLGREVIVSFLASQFISNVPASVLLADFTHDWQGMLAGTNIGGLGTPIASLASLITFSEFRVLYPGHSKQYFWMFTGINAGFLAVMLVAAKLFFL